MAGIYMIDVDGVLVATPDDTTEVQALEIARALAQVPDALHVRLFRARRVTGYSRTVVVWELHK